MNFQRLSNLLRSCFSWTVDEQILKLKDSIETGPSVGKGLFSMKFMAQSVEKRKKEAQEVRASL